jgi:hypothetical protein
MRHLKRGVTGSVADILIGVVGVNDTMNHIILTRIALSLSLIEEHLLMVVTRDE